MNLTSRWPTWRRDLVAGVIGAILVVAVLVPVGWSQIQTERDRAEAIERDAAEARARLEALLRAEHDAQTALAEANDAMLNAMVKSELTRLKELLERETDPVRKKQLQERLREYEEREK